LFLWSLALADRLNSPVAASSSQRWSLPSRFGVTVSSLCRPIITLGLLLLCWLLMLLLFKFRMAATALSGRFW